MADITDYGEPNISGDSLTCWTLKHTDKFFSGFSHIPKDRWDAIFGRNSGKGRLKADTKKKSS